MTPANKRTCQVTADSDPTRSWMTVEASSIFHAAVYYWGACAGRSGGQPVPTPASIITLRVDGREYRVREGRMRESSALEKTDPPLLSRNDPVGWICSAVRPPFDSLSRRSDTKRTSWGKLSR